MKTNTLEKGRPKLVVALAVLAALALVGVGATFAYAKLKAVYLEQCVIRDFAAQVEITSGRMVHPSTIAEELGLRVGANLAAIDFAERRRRVLEKVPNLLALRIERHLPDRVTVVAEERTPIARLGIKGRRQPTGRVVDAEGMVFICQRGTQALPVIREAQAPGLAKGHRVSGRLEAALRLVEACRDAEFLELGLLEVDTSKPDFLVATLGNYSRAKILWEDMDEPTPRSRADLLARLTLLRDAIRARVSPETVLWNATIPGRIFTDTQGRL